MRHKVYPRMDMTYYPFRVFLVHGLIDHHDQVLQQNYLLGIQNVVIVPLVRRKIAIKQTKYILKT